MCPESNFIQWVYMYACMQIGYLLYMCVDEAKATGLGRHTRTDIHACTHMAEDELVYWTD